MTKKPTDKREGNDLYTIINGKKTDAPMHDVRESDDESFRRAVNNMYKTAK